VMLCHRSCRRDTLAFPMSIDKIAMIERYWHKLGGALFLEFPVTKRTSTSRPRWAAGLIVAGLPKRRWEWSEAEAAGFDITTVEGKDIVVIQAKAEVTPLGMPLLGQTLFAVELLKDLRPASMRGVALCRKEDSALRRVFETVPGMEVVVDEP
jgi:hypothetical protein